MSDHELLHEWSGAYVLGALEADERRSFETHLDECSRCRDEVAAFAPIPGLLAHLESEPTPASVPGRIGDEAVRRANDEWRRVVRSRQRWRWMAVAAMFIAALLSASVLLAQDRSGPTALTLEGEASGSIAIEQRAWGTSISIELEHLPASDRYVAWAVDAGGEWQQVAVWGPTPESRASVSAATSVPMERLDAVVVTTGGYRDRVVTAVPAGG